MAPPAGSVTNPVMIMIMIMNFRLTPSTGTTRSFSALENKGKESEYRCS